MLLIYFQQQATPELGLNSTREKRVPNAKLRSNNQQNCSVQGVIVATRLQ
jgi:hypothetical protein